MTEMIEAQPRTVKRTETRSSKPNESYSFGSRVRSLRNSGRAAILSTFLGAAVISCGGGNERINVPSTQDAGTPGVEVVQMTPTGAPIETATIANFLTPTAKAEATKTAQPTQTPEATATVEKENLSQPYQIELSDQLNEMQAKGEKLRSGNTPEEFVQKLTKEVETYPKIGNLKIKLYIPTADQVNNGEDGSYFYNSERGGPYVLLNVDLPEPIEKLVFYTVRHEILGHYFSTKANGTYLRTILTDEQFNQLEQIENDTTHDPLSGLSSDQDASTEYFSDKMIGANNFVEPDAPLSALEASSRRRGIAIELCGQSSPADNTKSPFLSAIKTQLDEIHAYATSPEMQQRADYLPDAAQTLDRNQAFINRVSAENPIMAEVYKDLRENQSALTFKNMQITANSGSNFNLISPTKGGSFEQLSYWGATIFLEKDFEAGDPIIVKAYKDKTAEINQSIEDKDTKARIEIFGDAMMVAFTSKNPNLTASKAITFLDNLQITTSQ